MPWMSKGLIKQIRDRKRLYVSEGGVRTQAWKERKKQTDALVKERKRGYMEKQKGHILEDDANRDFYRHVRTFSTHERPKLFTVRNILPGKSNHEVAEELASILKELRTSLSRSRQRKYQQQDGRDCQHYNA